jgi:hypothetical protein
MDDKAPPTRADVEEYLKLFQQVGDVPDDAMETGRWYFATRGDIRAETCSPIMATALELWADVGGCMSASYYEQLEQEAPRPSKRPWGLLGRWRAGSSPRFYVVYPDRDDVQAHVQLETDDLELAKSLLGLAGDPHGLFPRDAMLANHRLASVLQHWEARDDRAWSEHWQRQWHGRLWTDSTAVRRAKLRWGMAPAGDGDRR